MNASHPLTTGIIRLTSFAAAAWISLVAARAGAQGVDEFGAYGQPQDDKDYQSPQAWAVELRVGPYYPQVDDEFNGAAYPLAETLGSGKRVLLGIEGDWQALRVGKLMSLGPGFGTAYTRLSNPAVFANPPDGAVPETAQPSGTSPMDSTLKLWLQWAAAVARVDALNRNFRIPIVFTAKLGMGHAFWWAGKGNLASRVGGSIGHGRSWGPMWALGVMFDLNFAQPERSQRLDAISGINHMYLFAEWYQLKLNGFGSGNQMQVGDSTWALGYALEF
jgi:hypothetical protein